MIVEIERRLLVVRITVLLIFSSVFKLLDQPLFLLVLLFLTLLLSLQVLESSLPFIRDEQFLSFLDVQLLTFG